MKRSKVKQLERELADLFNLNSDEIFGEYTAEITTLLYVSMLSYPIDQKENHIMTLEEVRDALKAIEIPIGLMVSIRQQLRGYSYLTSTQQEVLIKLILEERGDK